MADIINLLPDSVANQIAAGEVIQRPASVVKELVENAIDAQSRRIHVIIKDAGRTLIQVIDDGSGMSETDARMAFERHATSKIKQINDLFEILTYGFRGEALASIAAVAQVELKTRRADDELGTMIEIQGSEVVNQSTVSCAKGSSITVKNLFYNVPVRRKFLKSNPVEFKHITSELIRTALAYPEIAFTLHHNDSEILQLQVSNHRTRIVSIFGKNFIKALIPVSSQSSILSISGYVTKPEFAKKLGGEQYFFVNKRYMRHNYFHKAVTTAYNKLISLDAFVPYFIYFEIDPNEIDVNIHPTKTEIKFTDAVSIYQILLATVKEALGKFNIVPSIDFDQEDPIRIPLKLKDRQPDLPTIGINPDFNPFEVQPEYSDEANLWKPTNNPNLKHWESLFTGVEKNIQFQDDDSGMQTITLSMSEEAPVQTKGYFQLKGKYIFVPMKSGMMIIDQHRAHERILFDQYVTQFDNSVAPTQRSLFPTAIELSPINFALICDILDEIRLLGFEIETGGGNTIIINGTPTDLPQKDITEVIESLIENYRLTSTDVRLKEHEIIARSLAKTSALNYGKILSQPEMHDLVDNLFACPQPNYTPDGRKIICTIDMDEIASRFDN